MEDGGIVRQPANEQFCRLDNSQRKMSISADRGATPAAEASTTGTAPAEEEAALMPMQERRHHADRRLSLIEHNDATLSMTGMVGLMKSCARS